MGQIGGIAAGSGSRFGALWPRTEELTMRLPTGDPQSARPPVASQLPSDRAWTPPIRPSSLADYPLWISICRGDRIAREILLGMKVAMLRPAHTTLELGRQPPKRPSSGLLPLRDVDGSRKVLILQYKRATTDHREAFGSGSRAAASGCRSTRIPTRVAILSKIPMGHFGGNQAPIWDVSGALTPPNGTDGGLRRKALNHEFPRVSFRRPKKK